MNAASWPWALHVASGAGVLVSPIHVETGELPKALEAFIRAREIHQAAGDSASEGRVLVNMAAAASELGRLADAEAWYGQSWRLSKDTGQDLSSAIIEGNLGYVASRRGDFSAALEWYQRGRSSFSQLGDVDLLVAVPKPTTRRRCSTSDSTPPRTKRRRTRMRQRSMEATACSRSGRSSCRERHSCA